MRKVALADVIGSGEFAEILGVKRKTVLNYLSREVKANWPRKGQRGSFPPPVDYIERSPVWRRQDAEAYQQNRPGPGWHQRGDDRLAEYLHQHPGADGSAPAGAEPDRPEDQPAGVDQDSDG